MDFSSSIGALHNYPLGDKIGQRLPKNLAAKFHHISLLFSWKIPEKRPKMPFDSLAFWVGSVTVQVPHLTECLPYGEVIAWAKVMQDVIRPGAGIIKWRTVDDCC